ncbi:MAG: hypothetical protein R2755_14590 [Acidimicrobiales bacterium]
MSALFALAVGVAGLAALVGYGAVFLSWSIGPPAGRLDAVDASEALAVSRALYRSGARRNEAAALLVGPALLVAAASSDGRLPWGSWWLWASLVAWALTVVVRVALIQPARRSALVLLGELAGAGGGDLDGKRAQVLGLQRRVQLGGSAVCVLCVAALAALAVGGTGLA